MADERYADKLKGIKSAEGEAYSEMHQAALRGEVAKMQQLIAMGTDVTAADENFQQTALHFACLKGQTECAQMLLENGADVNALNFRNRTPLHNACLHRHLGCVRLMIENGGNMDAVDQWELTPRMSASNCKGGYPELLTPKQLEDCDGIMALFGISEDKAPAPA